MKKTKIGQSTIEYVIMFAIIVGAIIIFAGRFRNNVGRAFDHLTGEIDQAVHGQKE